MPVDDHENAPAKFMTISVIIPLREESENVGNLLYDLENQNYPKEYFEVILVDDHSGDDTTVLAKGLIKELRTKVIILQNSGEGKKEAIETGIRNASGEVIITTDGDCRLGNKWISTIHAFIEYSNAVMVSALVRYNESKRVWDQGLMMEFAALQCIGSVTLKMGLPTMCNGANLAYLREVFFEVDGFEGNREIPSGDDEFLLHKISKRYPGRIHFLKNPDAVVDTKSSFGAEWLNQRKRWASKWKGYKILPPRLIAIIVVIFNLNVIYGFLMALAGYLDWTGFSIILFVKISADYILIYPVCKFLKRSANFLIFILMEMIYPLYVLIFGILGLLGNYTWKGRTT